MTERYMKIFVDDLKKLLERDVEIFVDDINKQDREIIEKINDVVWKHTTLRNNNLVHTEYLSSNEVINLILWYKQKDGFTVRWLVPLSC